MLRHGQRSQLGEVVGPRTAPSSAMSATVKAATAVTVQGISVAPAEACPVIIFGATGNRIITPIEEAWAGQPSPPFPNSSPGATGLRRLGH